MYDHSHRSIPVDAGFLEHLAQIVDVDERTLAKIIEEVLDHWSETEEQFVLRRHRELQRGGVRVSESYGLIAAEVARRPLRVPRPSERQIRRLLYG